MKNIKKNIIKRLVETNPLQASQIVNLLSPTIGIETLTKDSASSKKVHSKFGGYPELPINFNWPKKDGNKLTFLCQINLEELRIFQNFSTLPKIGMLYFFILTEGLDRYPEQANEFCVVHLQNLHNINTNCYQTDVRVFDETALKFFKYYTLPDYHSFLIRDGNEEIGSVIEDFKEEIYEMINLESDNYNQILGFPQSVQENVAYSWAFEKLGFKSHDLNTVEKDLIKKMESKYVNLLQIDFANSGTNFSEYGGDGVAYFGMHCEDLENGKFENCFLTIQST